MPIKPTYPKWIPGGQAARQIDPGESKRDLGFIYEEKPPHQWFNWSLYNFTLWINGLQGSFFDITVGSAAQVTANEATNVLADLIDANVPAGSKVLILDGTHTLLANMALSNVDLVIVSESPAAIVAVSTFQILMTGARQRMHARVTGAGANDIQFSGAGSHFEGIDVDISAIQVTTGAAARANGEKFNGRVSLVKGAVIASAAALTLGTDGNYFDVTGTTSITSIGTTGLVGTVIKLHFDGVLTLTHHATDLFIPGGVSIVTVAGDEVELVEYAAGDWRVLNHTRSPIARGCLVFLDANQTLSDVTTTILNFDQEDYDTNGIHDNVTNNGRLTVPVGVTKVRVSGQVWYNSNATGRRDVHIYKNADTAYIGHIRNVVQSLSGSDTVVQVASPILRVVATDYFELRALQNSGGNLDVAGTAAGGLTHFAMEIIE